MPHKKKLSTLNIKCVCYIILILFKVGRCSDNIFNSMSERCVNL